MNLLVLASEILKHKDILKYRKDQNPVIKLPRKVITAFYLEKSPSPQ